MSIKKNFKIKDKIMLKNFKTTNKSKCTVKKLANK